MDKGHFSTVIIQLATLAKKQGLLWLPEAFELQRWGDTVRGRSRFD